MKLVIKCPICGYTGVPHDVAVHFRNSHPFEYKWTLQNVRRYNQGWICKWCGRDFMFITSAYVHLIKECKEVPRPSVETNEKREEVVIERW